MFGALPIAYFSQKYGIRNGLVILFTTRSIAFFLLSLTNSFICAIGIASLVGLLSRGTAPLIESALVMDADNNITVKMLATLRMIRNIGFAAGGIPAGYTVWVNTTAGYRVIIAISSLIFLLAAIICWQFQNKNIHFQKPHSLLKIVLKNYPFIVLTSVYSLAILSAILLGIGIPLWIIHKSHVPSWTVGLIQTLNTFLVVLLQRQVSKNTEQIKVSISRFQLGVTFAAIGSGILFLAGENSSSIINMFFVIIIVIAFTFAELFIIAGAEGMSLSYIPEGQRTVYFAILNLGFAAATVIGPPLATITSTGTAWWWLIWALFFSCLVPVINFLPKPSTL
ncbi:MAG: hypothetical protein EKK54_01240 [Neisseriaceae bacterium]|nr:MAG: hypothetical protein EKK54_01240 [Neisseriaceae bacterium]